MEAKSVESETSSDGIKREELVESFVNQLTEPANKSGRTKNGEFWAEVKTFSWIGVSKRVYQKFRIYLQQLGVLLLSTIVVVMACSLRGYMLLIASLTYISFKAISHSESVTTPTGSGSSNCIASYGSDDNCTTAANLNSLPHPKPTILPDYLQLPSSYQLPDLLLYVTGSVLISEVSYHLICGVLQIYFYILRRNSPEEWKCQPHRFLTRSNEIHEIIVGTANMVLAGAMSGVVTCWISSGRYTTMYFTPGHYGYAYLLFSVVLLFVWLEASAYYIHMSLHTPWLYKNIHKHHHRYHTPTAYSAMAMSPIELACYDVAVILPLFVVPIYSAVFVVELVYIYYFGLIDHSGVRMDSWFPWQPSTTFHDNHHRYFHCNFGFNSSFFDWLHGTLRKTDTQYGEDIFNPNKKKL